MDQFDPRIADIPSDVLAAIKKALGRSDLIFTRPTEGTTGRTFIVESNQGKHIVRLEENPGNNLRRAILAIGLAQKAGVAVPTIHAIGSDKTESFFWYIESFALGDSFPHRGYEGIEVQAATRDLGLNLRKLNSVQLEKYGLLPPNPWINWDTSAERYKSAAAKVERAIKFAQVDSALLKQVLSAYEFMIALPESAPCLCAADCRTSNILTHQGKISAIIDWEWANGDRGASDFAAWHFSNHDPKALDLILEGYQPDDEVSFRRQVSALIVVGIVTDF